MTNDKSIPNNQCQIGLDEILKATQGRLISQHKTSFSSIFIDTRTLKPGALYICIVGKNHDGHKFIGQAIEKGATGILISKYPKSEIRNLTLRLRSGSADTEHRAESRCPKQTQKITIIKVKDTLKALQDLAAYHRAKFDIPVVGITGSCGKTTTKDMIASILSQKMPAHKNQENLNNEIGVPLTLLNLKPQHKAAVIEMGMQGLKEIELLAKITRPTIAVITNIGEAHLLQMKHKKNIAKAKSEILKFLKPGDTAILPADDEYFKYLKSQVISHKSQVITFGIYKEADVMPKDLEGINLPIPGYHSIYNALSAIAVAKALKIVAVAIKKGLENFETSSNRMKIIKKKHLTIINDAYNANPTSMRAALNTLAQWDTERVPRAESRRSRRVLKVAILGDMLELGKHSKKAHFEIGKLVAKLKIDLLISIGKESQQIFAGAKKAGLKENYYYSDKKAAAQKVKSALSSNAVVLIKGSRGMHLEELLNHTSLS